MADMAKYPPLLYPCACVISHTGIRAQKPYYRFLRG